MPGSEGAAAPDAIDRLALRFSRFFIRHRRVNLVLIGAATAFFGYKALQLQVFSQFIDLLPRQHPFIQVYEKYNRRFGSANVVAAALVAKGGTLYDERVLEKVYAFTDQIDKVEGVDHGQVSSITSISVRDQEIDAEGTLHSAQLVGDEIVSLLEAQFFARRAIARAAARDEPPPGDLPALRRLVERRKGELAELLAPSAALRLEKLEDRRQAEAIGALRREAAELEFLALRLDELGPDYRLEGEDLRGPWGSLIRPELLRAVPDRIRPNKLAYGRLVSLDESAALVIAGFLEGRLDYQRIFREIRDLKRELEADGSVEVHLTGIPILAGWCFHYAPEILLILGASLGLLVVLLGVYFRRWYGVVLPFTGAVVSAIWGLGFISLMDYQLEPLVLVIPMLITARAVSHSVQFVERFYEKYELLRDKEEATVVSMAELLRPGTLAILTDAFGILVIAISSIALMKKLAFFGAFWASSIIVTEMLLNRLLIIYLPAPRHFEHYTPGVITAFLRRIARVATAPGSARITFGVWAVVVIACFVVAPRVPVGEARPGTPILWDDSEFNRSAAVISQRFFGADDLMVLVETEAPFGAHRPEVMREIEAFQRYMEQDPKVGGSISLVDYLKAITRTFHNDDPRWAGIPYDGQQIGGLLYLYEAGSPDPRVLNPYRDDAAQVAAVRIFYADHQGETIRNAIARVRRYIRQHPTGKLSIRLDAPDDDFTAKLHYWLGPLLPPRLTELVVLVRDAATGAYERQAVSLPDRRESPPEDSTDWILTLPRMTRELREVLVTAGYDKVQKIADAEVRELAALEGYDLATAYQLHQAAQLDRRRYVVKAEWRDPARGIVAQVRKRGLYENPELWVRYRDGDFLRRESGTWAEGPSFALASGLMGVLAASNDEVEGSNNGTLIACFAVTFLMILLSYRSLAMALLLIASLGTATLISLGFMWAANIGFDVNTLPVQSLGVGVGDDYALYIMDRVIRERKLGHDLLEAIRIAIHTTGKAITFTGSTLVGGIIFWYFLSSLRFAADMSLLLSILLVANLFGAILLIPAFTALFRPRFVRAQAPPAGREESAAA
ncbi:MAG TPA: MMPL family transporter [Myxococcota bacterium]|nr:MMPL family transporter [Myxococcota bacterium]